MRIVIQRVSRASVRVAGAQRAAIGAGLLLLVGVERDDDAAVADKAAEKIVHLRIFAAQDTRDERMERSVLDIGGEILVVSQFTLAGTLRKGRRPGFDGAAPPDQAEPIYERLVSALSGQGARVAKGVFRAMMEIELVNDGPVTFILEPAE
ncbi:MAG TPA: D-aminoacyl-tRNA deacylase [Patescibacteria group bacterium]|nr:D-aminoacyl-tRNA deacylase [Patescibacteria group bacterium]